MQYNVKKWLMEASKEDLIDAATRHSISTGITNVYQLRRMLLDKFEWNHSHTDKQASARFLSTCVGKLSYPAEELTLGWVVTRDLEDTVKVGLNENFKWQGLDALVADVKKQQKERAQRALEAGRADRARNEERLGESLVDELTPTEKVIGAQTGPRMVQVESHVCGGSLSVNVHRDDGTSYQIKGEDLEDWKAGRFVPAIVNSRQGDGVPTQFTPVEPNPESLDDLSLEDLLGHYSTVDLRMRNCLTLGANFESQGDFVGGMEQARRAIDESDTRDKVLEHIERRFEQKGWMISRIKGR